MRSFHFVVGRYATQKQQQQMLEMKRNEFENASWVPIKLETKEEMQVQWEKSCGAFKSIY